MALATRAKELTVVCNPFPTHTTKGGLIRAMLGSFCGCDIVDEKDVSRSVQLNSGFLPIALVTLSWLVKHYILHGKQ